MAAAAAAAAEAHSPNLNSQWSFQFHQCSLTHHLSSFLDFGIFAFIAERVHYELKLKLKSKIHQLQQVL